MNRSQIASAAGRAAHENGTAHEWTAKEARKAGYQGVAAKMRLAGKTEEEIQKKLGANYYPPKDNSARERINERVALGE